MEFHQHLWHQKKTRIAGLKMAKYIITQHCVICLVILTEDRLVTANCVSMASRGKNGLKNLRITHNSLCD